MNGLTGTRVGRHSLGAALALGALLSLACAGEEIPTQGERGLGPGARGPDHRVYEARLRPVNAASTDRASTGRLQIEIDGDRAEVLLEARGLASGVRHGQYLRGHPAGASGDCPTGSADVDGDGVIALAEGVAAHGPALLALDDDPLDGVTSPGGFPAAVGPEGGVRWSWVGSLAALDAAVRAAFGPAASLAPLDRRQVVLHGADPARLPAGFPAAVLPIACGELQRVE